MPSKIADARACIARIPDGASVMMGGFGVCGIPENMVRLLVEHGAKNLTIVSNNAGVADFGIGLLINAGQVRKMISTYVGENPNLEKAMIEGRIDVELVPQGTFAERIRAAGAGIGAFFTPTGYGTELAQGKEVRALGGRMQVLELPLHADYALIQAERGDRWGNLTYRKTARNFGPVMATAARITVAQVHEIVELGEIDPETVVTPGVYVQRLVRVERKQPRVALVKP